MTILEPLLFAASLPYSRSLVNEEKKGSRRSTKVAKSKIRWDVAVAFLSGPHTYWAISSAVECLAWGGCIPKGFTSETPAPPVRCFRPCVATPILSPVIKKYFSSFSRVPCTFYLAVPFPYRRGATYCLPPVPSRNLLLQPKPWREALP